MKCILSHVRDSRGEVQAATAIIIFMYLPHINAILFLTGELCLRAGPFKVIYAGSVLGDPLLASMTATLNAFCKMAIGC
jgi:hypothetical protein